MQAEKIWLKAKHFFHLISEDEYRRAKVKLLPHINKSELDAEIDSFTAFGTTAVLEPKLIVSLTSFPERINEIKYTLFSLLTQSLKPDAVILWLAPEQFPRREQDLPHAVLKLRRNGLIINWCQDWRSYKKLVPTLLEYPEATIVTADDDIYYPPIWLERLVEAQKAEPRAIHGHRGHRLRLGADNMPLPYKKWQHRISGGKPSFYNFLTGAGGILYPPHSLAPDAVNTDLFQALAPNADDIWFWTAALLAGTPVNVVKNNLKQLIYVNPERELKLNNELTLAKLNTVAGQNDRQLQNIFAHYPQIAARLKQRFTK